MNGRGNWVEEQKGKILMREGRERENDIGKRGGRSKGRKKKKK